MRPIEPLPERFKLQREDGALELSWSWKRPSVLPFVLFLCCCPSPCGLYGQALVEGKVAIEEGGSVVGYAKVPWLGYLLMAGAILFSAALILLVLTTLVNHTTLRAERGWLRVRHWPIPLPKTELRASDIVRFEPQLSSRARRVREFEDRIPPELGPEDEYRLNAIDRKGTRYRVVSALETLEQCAWVERELRRALGMREQAERG